MAPSTAHPPAVPAGRRIDGIHLIYYYCLVWSQLSTEEFINRAESWVGFGSDQAVYYTSQRNSSGGQAQFNRQGFPCPCARSRVGFCASSTSISPPVMKFLVLALWVGAGSSPNVKLKHVSPIQSEIKQDYSSPVAMVNPFPRKPLPKMYALTDKQLPIQ